MTPNSPKMTQNGPKWPRGQKWPKMAQKLAPAEKNSTDISAASAAFCISAFSPQFLVEKLPNLQLLFFEFFLYLRVVTHPPTCKIQWAISQNTIFGHNFWLECPTKVISTQLSYILNALFRDAPFAYFFRATCHLATWSAKTIGKRVSLKRVFKM